MHEITEAITAWIADYGVYAVFGLSLIDAVLPAASELVMVYAGALATGAFSDRAITVAGEPIESTLGGFLVVAVAGTVGYVVGSVLGWAIGLYGGRPYLERHGRWLHVTPEKLDRAEAWFARYGGWTVLLGRCLPVVRSFVSIPAGIAEMALGRYTALTTIGTIPWYFGLAGVGVAVGASWERFHETWRYADYAVAVLVVAAIVLVLARERRKRVRRRALERSA